MVDEEDNDMEKKDPKPIVETDATVRAKEATVRAQEATAQAKEAKAQAKQATAEAKEVTAQIKEAKVQAKEKKLIAELVPAEKIKKRRRHLFIKLLVLLLCMALAAGFVWQFRQKEIDRKISTISELRDEVKVYEQEKKADEEEKKVSEKKYSVIENETFSISIPSSWAEMPTQFPGDEKVYGDDNVTIRIINSQLRNSVSTFIPTIDYLWQISEVDNSLSVSKKSRHCQRFDTLDNDLSNPVKEHDNFKVYCDEDEEKTIIGALATPESYGVLGSNVYFMIEINDVQQVNFDEIEKYIGSYVAK